MNDATNAVTVKIRWADVDAYGHLRHSAYADWATFARSEWFESVGLDPQVFAQEGVAPITLEETTSFLKEVRLGDILTLSMLAAAETADGSRFVHTVAFQRKSLPVARYRMTGAWFNLRERKIVPPTAAIAACVTGLLRSDNFATLG